MSFDIPDNAPITDDNGKATVPYLSWWSRTHNLVIALSASGTTINRPVSNLWTGRPFFDTTLGIPIWYNGTIWVDATGAAV